MNNVLISLLTLDGFICVNKKLIKLLGTISSLVFGELASEYVYWTKEKSLDTLYSDNEQKLTSDWFFSTIENVEKNTGLNAYYQEKAIRKLKEYKIIETKRKEFHGKRYIRIDEKRVKELLENDV